MSNIFTNSTAALVAILFTAMSFNVFIVGPAQAEAVITMAPVLA